MIKKPSKQGSLMEYSGIPPNICPCCLGKTWRDPAEILKDVEKGNSGKSLKEARMKKDWATPSTPKERSIP